MLHAYDACNLGSINLSKFVNKKEKSINYVDLKNVVKVAVRMLDNVIDLTDFPVQKVNEVSKKNRRIGLGIMGLADFLYKLELGYNTDEARQIVSEIMSYINTTAHNQSRELAIEKGCFENFKSSVYCKTEDFHRNAALTNIAPTGTTSLIFDVSNGIEPYFALAYNRSNGLTFLNKELVKVLKKKNLYNEEIIKKITSVGSIQNMDEIPYEIRKVFVTAMDISPQDHIYMQKTCQKYCDNSISKTINMKESSTISDVSDVFLLAYKKWCKCITVYRNGSRKLQVLNLNKK